MDSTLRRTILLQTLQANLALLDNHGISFEMPSDSELNKMSLPDLADIVRRVEILARTPTR